MTTPKQPSSTKTTQRKPPVSTGTTTPVALATTTPATPTKTISPRPATISTPKVLSLWRVISVTAIAVATALLGIALISWSDHLSDTLPQNNVALHLETVQDSANSAVAAVPNLTAARNLLESANQTLTEIGGLADPSLNVATISGQLIDLTVQVTLASENPSTEATAGLKNAQSNLDDSLTSSIELARTSFQAGRQFNRWIVGLVGAVPVLLLVGASVVTANRTHRLVNLGLVAGIAGTVLAWYLTDQAIAASGHLLTDPALNEQLFDAQISSLRMTLFAVVAAGTFAVIATAYGLRARIREFR